MPFSPLTLAKKVAAVERQKAKKPRDDGRITVNAEVNLIVNRDDENTDKREV